ncbi:hypothetical protein [Massilia phosphatilytica]
MPSCTRIRTCCARPARTARRGTRLTFGTDPAGANDQKEKTRCWIIQTNSSVLTLAIRN